MKETEIKKKYPSICYNCKYARNVHADLVEQGYVGCILPSMIMSSFRAYSHLRMDLDELECQDKGWGWVQQNHIFDEQTMTMINDALISKCVSKCSSFEKKYNTKKVS